MLPPLLPIHATLILHTHAMSVAALCMIIEALIIEVLRNGKRIEFYMCIMESVLSLIIWCSAMLLERPIMCGVNIRIRGC